jgi:hypothetical protein
MQVRCRRAQRDFNDQLTTWLVVANSPYPSQPGVSPADRWVADAAASWSCRPRRRRWADRPRCGWGAVHVRAAAQLRSHHRLSAATVPSDSGVVYRDLAIMTASWVLARKPRHDHQTHLDLQPGCRCRVGVLDWRPQGTLPRGCDRPVGPSGPGPMRSFWRPICNARSPPARPTVARAGSALLGFRHERRWKISTRLSAFAQARLDRAPGHAALHRL